MPKYQTLDAWLAYQKTLHSRPIDLGLGRIKRVWKQLGFGEFDCPIIVVGGTNGKGSTIHCLQTCYHHAGYRTGVYTSPHLLRYNERIDINQRAVTDTQLIAAFSAIEQARLKTPLTYFEFATLAAFYCFAQINLDIILLEVGLGGRLDAVNILNHDVAIVTNVALDHMDWLGNTTEKIAYEKAGIARKNRPLIYGDIDPPDSLINQARQIGARLYLYHRDFVVKKQRDRWEAKLAHHRYPDLCQPSLVGEHQLKNCVVSLQAMECLSERLPVNPNCYNDSLRSLSLPGRFQIMQQNPQVIVDVAHNASAVCQLAMNLNHLPCSGKTLAVFAMQKNRDVLPVIQAIFPQINQWYVSTLQAVDSQPAQYIARQLRQINANCMVYIMPSIAQALKLALERGATAKDRVIVFGSFYTVAQAMSALQVK